jgi:hypothetical protein
MCPERSVLSDTRLSAVSCKETPEELDVPARKEIFHGLCFHTHRAVTPERS